MSTGTGKHGIRESDIYPCRNIDESLQTLSRTKNVCRVLTVEDSVLHVLCHDSFRSSRRRCIEVMIMRLGKWWNDVRTAKIDHRIGLTRRTLDEHATIHVHRPLSEPGTVKPFSARNLHRGGRRGSSNRLYTGRRASARGEDNDCNNVLKFQHGVESFLTES